MTNSPPDFPIQYPSTPTDDKRMLKKYQETSNFYAKNEIVVSIEDIIGVYLTENDLQDIFVYIVREEGVGLRDLSIIVTSDLPTCLQNKSIVNDIKNLLKIKGYSVSHIMSKERFLQENFDIKNQSGFLGFFRCCSSSSCSSQAHDIETM